MLRSAQWRSGRQLRVGGRGAPLAEHRSPRVRGGEASGAVTSRGGGLGLASGGSSSVMEGRGRCGIEDVGDRSATRLWVAVAPQLGLA
jgi:hypothetical protein